MKKLYAFFAAALLSVSVFAAKDVVPSDAVLAEFYEPGQICVCIYVDADLKCNDIVFVGTYNGWSAKAADCAKFEAIEGYDGWYVVAVTDETAEPDPEKGLQGKPVQLDGAGEFSWDYQAGAATAIRGGAQVVQGGVAGEIDIVNYGTDAPNVYTVDAWKKDPCSAVYNSYTITVINDGCGGYVVPFVIGGFNNWAGFQQMQLDVEKTQANNAPTYYYSFRAAAGTEYQLVSGLMGETGEIETEPAWADDAYLQELKEGTWERINGGANFALGEETEVVYDIRVDTLQWARCDDTPAEHVVMWVNLPVENRPEAVEIIGGFDGWAGTAMELLDNGWFFVQLDAKPAQFFKFRGAGSWDYEIELYNAEDDEWHKIGDGELVFGQLWQEDSYKGNPCKSIELDFSTGRWTSNEGIENVVLTEKAQKVVVDGVIYIIRDNKMFNLQGAQVR